MNNAKHILLLVPAIIIAVSATTADAAGDAPDKATAIDPNAMVIFKKATEYLTRQPHLQFTAEVTQEIVHDSGMKLQFSSRIKAVMRRPDRMAAWRRLDDGNERRFWYDGQQATLFDRAENVYAQLIVPGTVDTMLDYMEMVVEAPQPLADLLYSDLSPLLALPTEAFYLGVAYLAGAACDHLAFRSPNIDWQVWVRQGDQPLIQKFIITYKDVAEAPQYEAVLKEWHFPAKLDDEVFRFDLPQGAQRINMITPPDGQLKQGASAK